MRPENGKDEMTTSIKSSGKASAPAIRFRHSERDF